MTQKLFGEEKSVKSSEGKLYLTPHPVAYHNGKRSGIMTSECSVTKTLHSTNGMYISY